MSVKRLFAVDLGASGGKCFVGTFDKKTFSMEEVHRFAHGGTSFFQADRTGRLTERTYWDDILIYGNIVAGLQAYRRGVADTLDSIGIDTWGADGAFISRDGDTLGKVYTYRDHRLDTMVEVVKSKVNPTTMYATTGIHFQPFNLSNQLCWFMQHRKELLTPGAVYLPIPSLLYYYLGGVKDVDSSWASVTQLMDAKRKKWSGPLLKKLGIPAALMPEIVAPGKIIGQLTKPLADHVDLNRAKLIAVASHDTASAFAAAPVDNPDEALIISSGTWSLVGKLVPQPITNPDAMALNVSNEGGVGNVRLLKNCMGTWLVQELRRVWAIADGKPMDWGDMVDIAKAAPAFVSFIDPDDKSFYNPANMEKAIMDFCRKTKQTPPKDRGTCLRMVYESLAMKYRLVNEEICQVSGTRTTVVNIVGGGSKNKMLNQFTANALGLTVMAGPEEATAVGNLMVQAMGLGIIKSLRDALPIIRKAFPIHPYTPQDVGEWSAAYARFRRVVK